MIVKSRGRMALLGFVLAGALAFALSLAEDPARSWRVYLASDVYLLSLSLAAAAFLAVERLSKAAWSASIRRVPEAMVAFLPAGCLLLLLAGFGLDDLYAWANAETVAGDHHLARRTLFLNASLFYAQVVGYGVLWTWLARRVVREPGRRSARSSALFLVVLLFTFTLASVSWILSLDPEWSTPLFPWYLLSSVYAGGLGAIAGLVLLVLPDARIEHRHDLGKFLFAFSVFWGYLWYCQFMLTWYADFPEETSHYHLVLSPGWAPWFWITALLGLAFPFLLLPARAKRNRPLLLAVAAVVVAAHWLDVLLLVVPAAHGSEAGLGFADLVVGLGFAALFLLLFDLSLRRASMRAAGEAA
ncbi:MAG: hypothetical protein HY720_23175 [Planctomycetes bacterium]|nr:hypothetical protein [Planctomycetota bacterium]